MRTVLFSALLLCTFANVGHAQTLKEQQIQKAQEGYLASASTSFNEACGTEIPVSIDWTSFKSADYTTNYGIHSYCSQSISAMESMCGEDDGLAKKAIASKIKKVVCHMGAERSAKLSDGTFDYTINFSSANDTDFVREFLGENL